MTVQPNLGYVAGQLAKALAGAAASDEGAEVRERAAVRARKWTDVFTGLLHGILGIGSRTPVRDAPPWATLEVVTGGFATGTLLAEGPLREHERSLLERLPQTTGATDRARINSFFVSDAGLAELQQMLASGEYRVDVPEEGALLTIAWLVQRGDVDAARALLDEIGPHFARLRFYPRPAPAPLRPAGTVRLQPVARTVDQLDDFRNSREVVTMREVIRVWQPLYDRLVALFVETVVDGWPCQHYPDGWIDRARALLADCDAQHGTWRRKQFLQLRRSLIQCVRDPRSLTGAGVGMIRRILASIERKRGLPGSARLAELRASQELDAARPMTSELARVLQARLRALPQDEGLSDAADLRAPAGGVPLPDRLLAALDRSSYAALETLVEKKVLASSEALAAVIPQLASHVRGDGLPDPAAMRLHAANYEAFRRRRSLLLLNLESQVRFEELPWARAIEAHRTGSAEERSRALLERVVTLAIAAFPHTILPNKLLTEIRALAQGAALDLPIVDELAADIFMGKFAGKFTAAAKRAAALLQGTLYERYYRIPYAEIPGLEDDHFAQLCTWLAGVTSSHRGSVAVNGAILEQSQIVTTHNLATLVTALHPQLDFPQLAKSCLSWVLRNLPGPHAEKRLRKLKNCAYAWRQMVFYLSLAPASSVEQFFAVRHPHEPVATWFADLRRSHHGARDVTPFLGWIVPPSART